ncbi:hypothetical protein PspLS_11643 [Pyricularia sp. CBS 133598]|nr:hypothetical protein PspLS_11643 [Pyricularia sp. CBS 133598]
MLQIPGRPALLLHGLNSHADPAGGREDKIPTDDMVAKPWNFRKPKDGDEFVRNGCWISGIGSWLEAENATDEPVLTA